MNPPAWRVRVHCGLAIIGWPAHVGVMSRIPLDESPASRFAWERYKGFLRWSALAALATVLAALAIVWQSFGADWLHRYIAVALAAGFIVLLTGALMGLVFLSSGAGHDEAVQDWSEPND